MAVTEAPSPATGNALLDIERSLTGRRWVLTNTDERQSQLLAQRHGLPDLIARLLASRGVGADQAEAYLNPRLRDWLPDPSRFHDMDKATERIARAIRNKEHIALFGDYDVDGATGTAVLYRFLTSIGAQVSIYIPDRFREGYGPNGPALLHLVGQGAQLVLTIDCGIVAHEALAIGTQAGLDIIVVDHHAAEPSLPPALAVINPNRLDEEPGFGQLAAVGVAFLLCVSLNRALRDLTGGTPDRLFDLLDLVALGTVCDVVPLTGLNRALVAQGLRVMARRGNIGLTALADIVAMRDVPSAYHAGFIFGPRINAGGRVGQSDLGVRLLTTQDPLEAKELANRLNDFNTDRQMIENDVLLAAIAQIEQTAGLGGMILAQGEGWHAGVLGIVASRLKDRYQRPACVVGIEGDMAKGSGRSVSGFDLGAAIIAARQEGIIAQGGGHRMAAGFGLKRENLPAFRDFLTERYHRHAAASPSVPQLKIDGLLAPSGATHAILNKMEALAPFGAGNPEPVFAFPDIRIDWAQPAGDKHVRCQIRGQDGTRLKAISFRSLDQDLGMGLLKTQGRAFHVAGRIRADRWQGKDDIQLMIEDAAPAS